jgi:hypothetical protein
MLSRPPVNDKGESDNNSLTLLPKEMFIRLHASKDLGPVDETLELKVTREQRQRPKEMQTW